MKTYRKKPVEIQALQYNGINVPDVISFTNGEVHLHLESDTAYEAGKAGQVYSLVIETLEGEMKAMRNDWIIKGVKGEFYPCKPDIFEATYELVEEI